MTTRYLVVIFTFVLSPTVAAAQINETVFESDGVELRAFLHSSPAGESHAVAIYLHGNPGRVVSETSTVASALTSVGVDVFQFNYRGLWGNGGEFNLTNAIGDLDAALDYLTSPETVERFGLDPSTIVLIGSSFGTATGLVGGSDDNRVDGIVSLVPSDHGYFGKELTNPDSKIRDFLDAASEQLFGKGGPIEGGEAVFVNDLIENSNVFSFVPRAESLVNKKLLFLAGVDDEVAYVEDHFFPLYRRLRVLEHPALEAHVLGMDHGFGGVGLDSLMQITADWILDSFPGRSAGVRSRR